MWQSSTALMKQTVLLKICDGVGLGYLFLLSKNELNFIISYLGTMLTNFVMHLYFCTYLGVQSYYNNNYALNRWNKASSIIQTTNR